MHAGKRETTQNIGHVKINIKDVVRNRRLQDVWALQVRRLCMPGPTWSQHSEWQSPVGCLTCGGSIGIRRCC